MNLLDRLLLSLADRPARGLVVFDLDATLLHGGARNLRILREFAAEHRIDVGAPDPWEFGWDIRDAWRGPAALREPLLQFWAARYFTSEYAELDRPMPGAAAFVTRVAEVADVLYLTGRDEPNMGAGTRRSLAEHGFAGELWMKPSPATADAAWKVEAIARLDPDRVAATFENEPGNANLFAQAFPDAQHYLLTTYHSPGAPPLDPAVQSLDGFV